MLIEKLITYLALVIYLVVPSRLCEGALNSKNDITVIEPVRGAMWISGQHSYPITWTQSKFCFKWNIELLDIEERKVAQISTGLSEFKEGSMRHVWLIPPTIQNGDYVIKICENSAPENCGRSNSFFIRTTKEIGHAEDTDFDAFSPIHTPQMKETLTFSGNATNNERSAVQRRLPHELRRQKRTERERLYFKYMSERIRHDPDQLQCAIERVHRPSKETFVEQYMKPRKPAILTGMMDNWEAMKSWSFDKLGSILTKGVKVNIMENTTPYSQWNEFRALFADMYKDPAQVIMTDFHQIYPELMDAINFPKFSKDYFEEVVDEDIRPPQLSFEMAPTRSGFHWRVEALNASLWSALIQGKKLWGLYPPSKYYVPGVNHNNHRTQNSQQSESFTWWIYTKPELQDEHKPQECLQEAGEILYIPSGWWWSNVNVDDTITMQKSFCDETNIRSCMDELKELGDSVADNFHADVYIQLRNYLAIHDPGFLTDDDRQFKSPIIDLGQTNSDHGENFHQNVWKKYFEEGIDDAKFSSNRDDEANV